MNDKDIIKKLLKIASNQQKILTKLAQASKEEDLKRSRWEAERSKLTQDGMFLYGYLSPDNPYRSDPFYAGIKDTPMSEKKPQTMMAEKSKSSENILMQAPQPTNLSADLVSLLSQKTPQLKGLLMVKPKGKFLDIDYDAGLARSKYNLSANDIKKLVADAVRGRYEVDKVVGLTNPDPKTFKPNWS